MSSKRSLRAYLPESLNQATLKSIFNTAQTAPLSRNTKPWQVGIVSGAAHDRLQTKFKTAVMSCDRPLPVLRFGYPNNDAWYLLLDEQGLC
ncbi:MAG: nitroreductase family protein [Pseudomonadales bacterium]|nr:nitroreductase family protein [Pseudomonadales bacterium]